MIPLDIPSLTTIQLTREAAFRNKDNILYHSNPFSPLSHLQTSAPNLKATFIPLFLSTNTPH